jgi:hypothetical protein
MIPTEMVSSKMINGMISKRMMVRMVRIKKIMRMSQWRRDLIKKTMITKIINNSSSRTWASKSSSSSSLWEEDLVIHRRFKALTKV